MSLLNTPVSVGKIKIHNRLAMPPMATAKADENGLVSDALCSYYDEKTRDGCIGLVITEHAYIRKDGKLSEGQLSAAEDRCADGLKKLAAVIQRNKSAVFAQLNHAGAAASGGVTGCETLGVSALPLPDGKKAQHILTENDIKELVSDFAAAALRVKKAGFDGVEIHSAHGYLLNQFYSPLTNTRTDGYSGNSLEGRTRFHIEVIRAVRSLVGKDYPVALRLGACDYKEGGSTIADAVKTALLLEKEGIDLLDISGGFCGCVKPDAKTQGYFSEITEAVKKVISIPVLLTGGITAAEAAEQLLAKGKADIIGVGRAILNDSAWAKKAMESFQL